jgi:hypothetical protein
MSAAVAGSSMRERAGEVVRGDGLVDGVGLHVLVVEVGRLAAEAQTPAGRSSRSAAKRPASAASAGGCGTLRS